MLSYWIGTLVGIALLAAAIPVAARVRHPEQKPFAAYLIFITIFVVVTMVLFNVLGWLAGLLGMASALKEVGAILLLAILASLPAFALAIWQVRKPPLRRGPPN
jgi:di/tricarboxylate transporter